MGKEPHLWSYWVVAHARLKNIKQHRAQISFLIRRLICGICFWVDCGKSLLDVIKPTALHCERFTGVYTSIKLIKVLFLSIIIS